MTERDAFTLFKALPKNSRYTAFKICVSGGYSKKPSEFLKHNMDYSVKNRTTRDKF